MPYPKPDQTYISRLLERLFRELEGLHKRIDEVERLRYYEDTIAIPRGERRTGLEVRTGMTAELVENIKAALTSNPPRVKFIPHSKSKDAQANATLRENFHNDFMDWINHPVPVLSEWADSTIGNGIGIAKSVFRPWPAKERRKKSGESDDDYLARQKSLKQKWGPPIKALTIHPLAFYFDTGEGNQVTEMIEHSWKPRASVYAQYNLDRNWDANKIPNKLTGKLEDYERFSASAISGQPDQRIRALPYGYSTENAALVTEYWNPDWYQVYVDSALVWEERDPSVKYFVTVGRTTSSRDADKFGLSVAEILRHNEPVINRMLTRQAEAMDYLVRKRLTIEQPESGQIELGEDNKPKQYTFTPDYAESLPPGARIVDPFEGMADAYQAMPMIQYLVSITNQHGIAPIIKGVPSGAGASGYRDNSLYLMARNQFQYLIDSFAGGIKDMIEFNEHLITHKIKQEVWMGNYRLRPSDIENFPCTIEVTIDPALPQNMIAEGGFYDRMHAQGHITRRRVREQGLGIEAPEEEEDERMFEDLKEALKPFMYQDVISTVLPPAPDPNAAAGGLVAADGQTPISSARPGRTQGGLEQMLTSMGQNGGRANGQTEGGTYRQGQPRIPPEAEGLGMAGEVGV